MVNDDLSTHSLQIIPYSSRVAAASGEKCAQLTWSQESIIRLKMALQGMRYITDSQLVSKITAFYGRFLRMLACVDTSVHIL